MLQKMADGKKESRVKWPFTAVKFLNSSGRSHSPLPDIPPQAESPSVRQQANSPWIGLLPMENSNPSSQDSVDMESATGGEDFVALAESHPGSVPVGVVRHSVRHASEEEARKSLKIDEGQYRPIAAETPAVAMVSGSPASPGLVTLYPREPVNHPVQPVAAAASTHEPVMLPDVSLPPPNYQVPVTGHYVNLNPPGYPPYAVENRAQGMQPGAMQFQGMYASPPPEYGRFNTPRVMGSTPGPFMGTAPAARHVVDQHSQTLSGLKQNFVRPHAGPAGVPDSRIICPNCQCDKWYIDMVTQQNPLGPTMSVMESRMTCLVCNGDVWQVDVLASSRRVRGSAAQVRPRAMDIEKIVTPSIYTPQMQHGNTMARQGAVSTPESGYSSSATPPSGNPWRVVRPRVRNPAPTEADLRVRQGRVARQLAYEEEEEGGGYRVSHV